MSRVMLALTITLFLWPCTTLPASAAWRICGSRYSPFCVVEEESSHPCALALTERGGQTWSDKRAAALAKPVPAPLGLGEAVGAPQRLGAAVAGRGGFALECHRTKAVDLSE